jgi:IS30 family transposase
MDWNKRRITKEMMDQVDQWLEEGITITKAAERLRVKPGTIYARRVDRKKEGKDG